MRRVHVVSIDEASATQIITALFRRRLIIGYICKANENEQEREREKKRDALMGKKCNLINSWEYRIYKYIL